MKVTPARRVAFEILRRVATEEAYAADLLHFRFRELDDKVKHEDAALATELTMGVLRWQRLLDSLLERHLKKSATSLDLEVLVALRLGLYQLRFLTRVPTWAAVNESVELVKRARKSSAASLVNAVLRRLGPAAREPVETLLPPDLPPAERLGILHSHPTWMVERWLRNFGEARTKALLEANNHAPRLTCAVGDPAIRDRLDAALEQAGLSVEPGRWLRSALSVKDGSPTATDAFRHGWFAIQDEASQMVPLLVDARKGDSVLDLCAAPGGKTAALARAAGPTGRVIAADLYPQRLRTMGMLLRRLRCARVELVALDAASPLPFAADFDCVLVDAPCSGTGTLARNPEIRWRLRPDDLADFHRRQTRFLSNALDRLARGGRLVYSTCTLEPEENEQVVADAVGSRRDIRRVLGTDALAPHLLPGATAQDLFDDDGYFRTFPPEHHTDGFFAAIFERPRT